MPCNFVWQNLFIPDKLFATEEPYGIKGRLFEWPTSHSRMNIPQVYQKSFIRPVYYY